MRFFFLRSTARLLEELLLSCDCITVESSATMCALFIWMDRRDPPALSVSGVSLRECLIKALSSRESYAY